MKEIEFNKGGTVATIVSLETLANSVKKHTIKKKRELISHLSQLISHLKDYKPTIRSLHNCLSIILSKLSSVSDKKQCALDYKNDVVKLIENTKKQFIKSHRDTITLASKIIKNNDKIITHDISSEVLGMLLNAKKDGLNTEILFIEEQKGLRKYAINKLLELGLNVKTTKFFMLNHFIKEVSKVIIDAIDITKDGHVIAKNGSEILVKLAKQNKIPVYLIANKYEFGDTKIGMYEVFEEDITKKIGIKQYIRKTYSHDVLKLEDFTKIISDKK